MKMKEYSKGFGVGFISTAQTVTELKTQPKASFDQMNQMSITCVTFKRFW
jgi:hypothetical protein